MDAIQEIERGRATPAVEVAPGLGEAAIDALARELDAPVPGELRRTLTYTSGITGLPYALDFTGRSADFEASDIFPAAIGIAGDEAGNFWVVDTGPEGTDEAPVFFLSHDPPVVVYESPTLAHFLRGAFRSFAPPRDAAHTIWSTNPGVVDRQTALAGADAQLRAFAEQLDERFELVDLRAAEPGSGFSWGRHGPRTEVCRHGHERLFAYAAPERKAGLFARLLGR